MLKYVNCAFFYFKVCKSAIISRIEIEHWIKRCSKFLFHLLDILELKVYSEGILDIYSYHSINQTVLSMFYKSGYEWYINKPLCKIIRLESFLIKVSVQKLYITTVITVWFVKHSLPNPNSQIDQYVQKFPSFHSQIKCLKLFESSVNNNNKIIQYCLLHQHSNRVPSTAD